MSDELNAKHNELVVSSERGLTTQLTGLVKRGLALLSSIEKRIVCFPTNSPFGSLSIRNIGEPYYLGQLIGSANGFATIPIGKELILEVWDPRNFSILAKIQPNDIQVITFDLFGHLANWNIDPEIVHLSHLIGLKELYLKDLEVLSFLKM